MRLWTVTDGKAGDVRQTGCLASALEDALAATGQPVSARRDWAIDRAALANFAAPTAQPFAFHALPREAQMAWRADTPDLVIGCGKRAAAVVATLKAKRKRAIFAVQILDPRANYGTYDLILPPVHDGIAGRTKGTNVFPLLGPPLYFSGAERARIAGRWAALGGEPGRRIAVLVGGHSKSHRLTEARSAALVRQLHDLDQQGFRLWIALSRRTPRPAAAMLRAFASRRAIRIIGPELPAEDNPYPGFLAFAEAAIVTADSVNMACEAASFGLPVHIFALEGTSAKFDRFHAALRQQGAARIFDGTIRNWTFPPLCEGGRAAGEILLRLEPVRFRLKQSETENRL